jgi:hypothetical protein
MTDHAQQQRQAEERPVARDWTIGPDFPRHADRVVGGRPRLSEGRWSHRYAACVECGTTSRPYAGQGRCRTCYGRHWRQSLRAAVDGGTEGG